MMSGQTLGRCVHPAPASIFACMTQVFEMSVGGHHHRVETARDGDWKNEVTWWVDGQQVATTTSSDDSITLSAPEEHELAECAGALRAVFTFVGRPVRATWFEGERGPALAAAVMGRGGIDLAPEEGSPAAQREEKMRERPRLYAARHIAGGIGKIIGPLLGALIVAGLLTLVRAISWPDWDLPLPDIDLPSIPWPAINLPSIPWPDWHLPRLGWQVPAWLDWILDHAKYVWVLLVGVYLAVRETRRRREQDELRAQVSADSAVREVPASETDEAEGEQSEPAEDGHEHAEEVEVLGGDLADEAEGRPVDQGRR